jgi:hypothetical protein
MNKIEATETAAAGYAGSISYRKVASVVCHAHCRYEEKRSHI